MTFADEWRQWHAEHERRRADGHGFLAITGLHWLDGTPRRFPDAPGVWATGPDGPVVALAEGEELVVDGRVVTGTHRFGVIGERAGVFAGFGDAVVEVARRGGFDIVRPRHPDHPYRLAYPGTPAFEPAERWAITGRYVPFDAPRPTTVGAAAEGLRHVYDAPGRIVFELDGRPAELTVFDGFTPGTFTVLFTDATSGVTTYAANRSLTVGPAAADGSVVIDFNRAVNLPCAYTDFATCPLPPSGNHLPVAIEAGERTPRERVHLPETTGALAAG